MKKGFTLIELIVVIAILAVLVGLGVGYFKGQVAEATLANIQNDIKVVENIVDVYRIKNGDELPAGENYDRGNFNGKKVYSIKGELGEIPLGEFRKIEPNKLGVKSKLKGDFVISENTGGVLYVVAKANEGGNDEAKLGQLYVLEWDKQDSQFWGNGILNKKEIESLAENNPVRRVELLVDLIDGEWQEGDYDGTYSQGVYYGVRIETDETIYLDSGMTFGTGSSSPQLLRLPVQALNELPLDTPIKMTPTIKVQKDGVVEVLVEGTPITFVVSDI